MFNDGAYLERLSRGELTMVVIADRQPRVLNAGQGPPGTRSQIVQLRRRDGSVVVQLHRYLRPDGSLGASGRMDPKRIYLTDRIVVVDHD